MISGIDLYWILKYVPPAIWTLPFKNLNDGALSFYYVTLSPFKSNALALASRGPQPFLSPQTCIARYGNSRANLSNPSSHIFYHPLEYWRYKVFIPHFFSFRFNNVCMARQRDLKGIRGLKETVFEYQILHRVYYVLSERNTSKFVPNQQTSTLASNFCSAV
jgi:hypothetical protein